MHDDDQEYVDVEEVIDGMLEKYAQRKRFVTFLEEIREEADFQDWQVEDYRGRFYYRGPAVFARNHQEFLAVIRATTGDLKWDSYGQEGFVIYPDL